MLVYPVLGSRVQFLAQQLLEEEVLVHGIGGVRVGVCGMQEGLLGCEDFLELREVVGEEAGGGGEGGPTVLSAFMCAGGMRICDVEKKRVWDRRKTVTYHAGNVTLGFWSCASRLPRFSDSMRRRWRRSLRVRTLSCGRAILI